MAPASAFPELGPVAVEVNWRSESEDLPLSVVRGRNPVSKLPLVNATGCLYLGNTFFYKTHLDSKN